LPLLDQPAEVGFQRLPLARGLAQHFSDGARQVGRLQQQQSQTQKQVACLVVEEGFGRSATAVVGEEHLSDAQQVADTVQGVFADSGQRVPAVAAGFLVEGGEGVDGLLVLGTVARGDGVVLALDVQHHHGVGPVQQIGHHHANALTAARGRRQHDRQLPGQSQEVAPEAADQDAGRVGGFFVEQQPGALDFGERGKTGAAMQGAAGSAGCPQHARQDHQSAEAGHSESKRQPLPQHGVVAVELPVVGEAVPAGHPQVGLDEQQEQHTRQVQGDQDQQRQQRRCEHAGRDLARGGPGRHGQGQGRRHDGVPSNRLGCRSWEEALAPELSRRGS
jgi:hypothetical protein